MNNHEKIKRMSLDEMVDFLADSSACDICTCEMEENKCMAVGCSNGIKQWLQQEAKRIKYEIWITDKAGIPTFIKEYPYKIQCWIWALINGYIYKGKHWYFKDERLEIRENKNNN